MNGPLQTPASPSPLNPVQNCRRPSRTHTLPLVNLYDAENLLTNVAAGKRPGRCAIKVLSIAIQDYVDSDFLPLESSRKDQQIVIDYLIPRGCKPEDICAMREDSGDQDLHPTRANILSKIRWLVEGAVAGDVLVFHYSGHGTQVPNHRGTELDGQDEAIVTMDKPCHDQPHKHDHLIIDNDLRAGLVDALSGGVTLIAIVDACNSGTILDLDSPGVRKTHDDKRTKTNRGRKASRKSASVGDQLSKEPKEVPTSTGATKRSVCTSPERYEDDATCQPNVICISACKDDEQAWEKDGRTVTYYVFRLLKQHAHNPLSFKELQSMLHSKVGCRKVKCVRRRRDFIDPCDAKRIFDRQKPEVTTLPGFEDLLYQPFRFCSLVHQSKLGRVSVDSILASKTNQLPAP